MAESALIEKLRATLDEHERVARAAVHRHGGVVPTSATEYILRTVAAHRRILERHAAWPGRRSL